MMPRFFIVVQIVGSIVVAWLLPAQPPFGTPLVCGSCAPSVTRKT